MAASEAVARAETSGVVAEREELLEQLALLGARLERASEREARARADVLAMRREVAETRLAAEAGAGGVQLATMGHTERTDLWELGGEADEGYRPASPMMRVSTTLRTPFFSHAHC